MLVIGERLNSSIKKVEAAIKSKDTAFIHQEVKQQVQAGAKVIDLNAGTSLKFEAEDLTWLIRTVTETSTVTAGIKIALDSSDPVVIEAGLEELATKDLANNAIVNSVTAEHDKLQAILPLVKKYNTQLIGLCMNEEGIPEEPTARCKLGNMILQTAKEYEISTENVYLDPLVLPISTDIQKGLQVLESIRLLKSSKSEQILTVIGLSNISYGLPLKNLLNRTFLIMAMAIGLDAAILNPLDTQLMSMVKAADVLLADDDYCMQYIAAYRNGELVE